MRISEHLPVAESGSGLQGMTLNEFLEILWRSRWLIASVLFVFCLAGLINVTVAQPIYSSNALLKVGQEATGMGALGGDSEDVSQVFATTNVDMEIEMLKSRLVLGQVVDHFNLDISAYPVELPIVGSAVARVNAFNPRIVSTLVEQVDKLEGLGSAWFDLGGWLDLDKYGRGDEVIEVERLKVPASFRGQVLTLVAGEQGSFRLLNAKGRLLAEGKVGEAVLGWLPTQKPHELLISELSARPGTHFKLSRRLRLGVVDGLAASLSVAAVGNPTQQAQEVGLLQMSLEGPDPEEITDIINRTIEIYVRHNAERKSAEIKGAIEFLEGQLPVIKARVERAEVALNEYRLQQGSVDLSFETQAILNKIVDVEKELALMTRQRQALLRKFTPRHDRVIAFDAEVAILEAQRSELERETARLPKIQQDILRLSRNARGNREIYTTLLNRLQELNVVEAATSGSVQVVDGAEVPYAPVAPVKSVVLVIYASLGMAVGIGLALLRKALRKGTEPVEDPEAIEQKLGLPVYAVVPHSPRQVKLSRKRLLRSRKHSVLSASDTEDLATESVRSLRTWLNFAFVDAKNNVLLITGPSPGVGKSFLSINLGVVLADASKRVLIIDADLRKGHLHRLLNIERDAGLSDAIEGTASTRQVIRKTEIDNLFIIPTGELPPNPSELLVRKRFASIVEEVSGEFDYVIIDSPPALAVTDAAVIGALSAGALLVLKADTHPLREIEQCVKRLRRSGVNLLGVVFNNMNTSERRYGYGRYYGHEYGGYYRDK